MAQDWDIKPRGDACVGCKEPFADKQGYYSALVFGKEGYARGDYCAKCWPACEKSAMPYSMWQGIFRMPAPPPEEPLKKETAESLLRKLMEEEDDSKANAIYILAVMLERKRILVEKDVQRRPDGVWIRLYEHRKTAETFLIPDPRLRLDQIQDVQREVVALLGGETGAPPGAAPAQDAAAPADGQVASSPASPPEEQEQPAPPPAP